MEIDSDPHAIKLQVDEHHRRLRIADQRLDELDEPQLRTLVTTHENRHWVQRLWTYCLSATSRERDIDYLVYEGAKRRVIYIDTPRD
jgi:hypothetical protein